MDYCATKNDMVTDKYLTLDKSSLLDYQVDNFVELAFSNTWREMEKLRFMCVNLELNDLMNYY